LKEGLSMDKTNDVSTRELTPLVFQLRELVPTGPENAAHLHRTQSSCGGEDTYESEE
jgi:hypothetical protein